MRFDPSLRDAWTADGEAWKATLPAGWMQGRSAFGGLTAAHAVALGARQVAADRPLRSAQMQLLRPTVPGPVTGVARVLREGRTASFVEVRIQQDGADTLVAQLVFGTGRPEATEAPAAPAFEAPPPDDLVSLPYLPGITPEFVQHVHMRWVRGAPPFSGGDEARFAGWCRFREEAGGVEGIVGLLDVWPCPSLSLLAGPAPASTVTWSLQILSAPPRLGWCGFTYETVASEGGFHTVRGSLFDEGGALLAVTEQLVAVYG